jgi:GntR family transcriptional regulator / MocR family aminotransferase
MRTLYKSRRTALVESLRAELGDLVEIHGSEAGMHLTVTLPEGYRDVEIATRSAKEKLWLWPLSMCYLGDKKRQGFMLGYANTAEEKMPEAVRRLRDVLAA